VSFSYPQDGYVLKDHGHYGRSAVGNLNLRIRPAPRRRQEQKLVLAQKLRSQALAPSNFCAPGGEKGLKIGWFWFGTFRASLWTRNTQNR